MIRNKVKNMSYDLVAKGVRNMRGVKLSEMIISQNEDLKNEKVAGWTIGSRSGSKNIERGKMRLMKIWGQMPQTIKAKTSVAEWQVREGMEVGYQITFRGKEIERIYKQILLVGWPRVSPQNVKKDPSIAVEKEEAKREQAKTEVVRVKEREGGRTDVIVQVGYLPQEDLAGSYLLMSDWTMSEVVEREWEPEWKLEGLELDEIVEELREIKIQDAGMKWVTRWKIEKNIWEKEEKEEHSIGRFIRAYFKIPE